MRKSPFILMPIMAFVAGVMLLSSCRKGDFLPYEEQVPLSLVMRDQPQTKSGVFEGDQFPVRPEPYPIGMWVCEHEEALVPSAFRPVRPGYDNLLASLQVGESGGLPTARWSYKVNGQTQQDLWTTKGQPIDVYAYYPHQQMSGPTSTKVPVTIDALTDVLWTGPIRLTSEQTSRRPVSVPLNFKHAMASVQVRISSEYAKDVVLRSITFKDARSRLYSEAEFNICDGTFTPLNALSEFTVTLDRTLKMGQEEVITFLIPPMSGYQDGQCRMVFHFNDDQIILPDYPLPDMLGAKSISSYDSGSRYIYNLTLSKTAYFSAIGVDNTWVDEQHVYKLE